MFAASTLGDPLTWNCLYWGSGQWRVRHRPNSRTKSESSTLLKYITVTTRISYIPAYVFRQPLDKNIASNWILGGTFAKCQAITPAEQYRTWRSVIDVRPGWLLLTSSLSREKKGIGHWNGFKADIYFFTEELLSSPLLPHNLFDNKSREIGRNALWGNQTTTVFAFTVWHKEVAVGQHTYKSQTSISIALYLHYGWTVDTAYFLWKK